jgi:phosphonopyruvate decarboxylase
VAIDPKLFLRELLDQNVSFYTGVPDSLLKEFCFCVDNQLSEKRHVIAANEGNAIALAAGYHLSTGRIPLVYMQNSGLGNAINPLLSLCDPDVYSIPMIVMIGWRGEPGVKDEPQHVKQGKIQLDLLDAVEMPYEILSESEKEYEVKISNVVNKARNKNRPVALVVKKKTFSKFSIQQIQNNNWSLTRESALEKLLLKLPEDSIIVSTTGKTSREIFEIREKNNQLHNQDFLTVGSMGHCSSIALGISISKPRNNVFCIDGDGAMLMHLGAISSVASLKPKNFKHILLNNEAHESVGGQKTVASKIDLASIVSSSGYNSIFKVASIQELDSQIDKFLDGSGPSLLDIKIKLGSREDLGRPTVSPLKNKMDFMEFIKGINADDKQ